MSSPTIAPYPGNPFWPSNYDGCRFVGSFISIGGTLPPAGSKIMFSPAIQTVLDPTADTPKTIFVEPGQALIGEIDSAGQLVDANGELGFVVPSSTDPDVNPVGWTYRVTQLWPGGRTFDVLAPAGQTVDLTLVSPVPSSPGNGIIQGLKGDTGYFNGSEALVNLGNVSGAVNCDLSQASAFKMVLVGNTVVTFTNPAMNKVNYATLRVSQDTTGARTLDVVGRQGSFGANELANLSSTANAMDEVVCSSWDNGAHWLTALSAQGIA